MKGDINYMTRILCMSHGTLAKGMVETSKIILGAIDRLDYICAYVEGNNDVDVLIEEYLKEHRNEEIIVVTDIFGGSINNAWLNRIQSLSNIYLVSGMNLSFIIELMMGLNDDKVDIVKAVKGAIRVSKNSFLYCNELHLVQQHDDF